MVPAKVRFGFNIAITFLPDIKPPAGHNEKLSVETVFSVAKPFDIKGVAMIIFIKSDPVIFEASPLVDIDQNPIGKNIKDSSAQAISAVCGMA